MKKFKANKNIDQVLRDSYDKSKVQSLIQKLDRVKKGYLFIFKTLRMFMNYVLISFNANHVYHFRMTDFQNSLNSRRSSGVDHSIKSKRISINPFVTPRTSSHNMHMKILNNSMESFPWETIKNEPEQIKWVRVEFYFKFAKLKNVFSNWEKSKLFRQNQSCHHKILISNHHWA